MKPKLNDIKGKRLLFLDIIRGFALVNMVLYHLLYNLVYIFNQSISWFSISKAFVWQQMICYTFIIVSGISFNLSKKPVKKAFILLVCALGISFFTYMFEPNHMIWFGIIHFFAAATFLTILLKPLLTRIPVLVGFITAVLLFILLRNLPNGYLSFFSLWRLNLPTSLYESTSLFFVGLPHHGFRSSDYFPIFPWLFLYLAGFYGYGFYQKMCLVLLEKHGFGEGKVYSVFDKTMGFLGRKSLIIYMLHQPVLYGILYLIYNFY